jgi:hypothetical protein
MGQITSKAVHSDLEGVEEWSPFSKVLHQKLLKQHINENKDPPFV